MSKIVQFPHKILLNKCKKVIDFNVPHLERVFKDMGAAMVKAHGVGIAANQIGLDKSMAIVVAPGGDILKIVNPTIVESGGSYISVEGCLSGEFRAPTLVKRPKRISIMYQTVEGDVKFLYTIDTIFATRIDHEIDHLNGITIFDYTKSANGIDRYIANRPEGSYEISDLTELRTKLYIPQYLLDRYNKQRTNRR